jgi:hypothetical protein
MKEYDESDANDLMNHLIGIGAIEVAGLDENGDLRFFVTEKAKDVAPELYNNFVLELSDLMHSLWKKNLVEAAMDSEGNWIFALTEAGYDFDDFLNLEPEEYHLLMNMRAFS